MTTERGNKETNNQDSEAHQNAFDGKMSAPNKPQHRTEVIDMINFNLNEKLKRGIDIKESLFDNNNMKPKNTNKKAIPNGFETKTMKNMMEIK